ncbi:MAG: MFS transporter [Faecousia sp.]
MHPKSDNPKGEKSTTKTTGKKESPIATTAGVFLSIFLVTSGTKLFTLFFPELERQRIPMTIVSLASVAATAAIFLSGLYIGKIIRVMGMKRMMLLGCALMAAAYVQFAIAGPVILFSGFICLGIATTLCGYTPASLIITNWYTKGRGLALSVVFTGMTLGTALYSALCGVLLTKYGLKMTALIVGGIVLCLGFPAIALLVKEAPAEAPEGEQEPSGKKTVKSGVLDLSEQEARKTSLFGLILLVTLLAAGLLSTVQSYIPSHLQNEGLSILQSSQVYSAMMLAGTAERFWAACWPTGSAHGPLSSTPRRWPGLPPGC